MQCKDVTLAGSQHAVVHLIAYTRLLSNMSVAASFYIASMSSPNGGSYPLTINFCEGRRPRDEDDIEDEELIQMKGQIIERTQQVRSMPSICCAALTTDVTHTAAEIPLSISCDNNTPEGKPVGACLEIPKECCGPGPSTSQASRFPVLYGQVPEQGRCSIQ